MDIIGATTVGGTWSSWEIVEPRVDPAVVAAAPAYSNASPLVLGGGYLGAQVGGTSLSDALAGGAFGVVGGSWSPEPAGNHQIFYGHYSSQGLLAFPSSAAVRAAAPYLGPAASAGAAAAPAAAAQRSPARTGQAAAAPVRAASAAAPGAGSRPAAPAGAAATSAQQERDPKQPARDAKQPVATRTQPATTPRAATPATHTVKAGESLSEVAAANGTTWQALYDKNRQTVGTNPNLIRPGQQLKLR